MRYIRWIGLLWLGLLLLVPSLAQESRGQVCIRAYEDRNGNGTEDPGEPLITRGLSITLADAQGVVVNSLLLEDSPRKSVGVGCFQNLPSGQYTLNVTSADFQLTTTTTFITSVSETEMPTVFDVGGQVIATQLPTTSRTDGALALSQASMERLFFASVGATLVVLLMIIVGALIYFLFFRVPAPQKRYAAVNPATGGYPAVNPATGSYPTVGTPGNPMRPVDPTTGQLRSVNQHQPFMPPTVPTPAPIPTEVLPPFEDTTPPDSKADTEPPTPPPAQRPDSKPFNPLDDTSRFRPPQG